MRVGVAFIESVYEAFSLLIRESFYLSRSMKPVEIGWLVGATPLESKGPEQGSRVSLSGLVAACMVSSSSSSLLLSSLELSDTQVYEP